MSLHRHFTATTIALVATFAALIAASTLVPEIILAAGVPLTLQTFAVVLTALVLGPWRAMAAVALYLVVGLAGAPIFANNVGGVGIVSRPTAGYLLGMLLAAGVVGALVTWQRQRTRLTMVPLIGAALVSIPVIYAVGIPVLAARIGLPVLGTAEGCAAVSFDFASGCANALTIGAVPFLPGDLIKVFLAAAVAAAVHRAYPSILPPRRLLAASAAPDKESPVTVTS